MLTNAKELIDKFKNKIKKIDIITYRNKETKRQLKVLRKV